MWAAGCPPGLVPTTRVQRRTWERTAWPAPPVPPHAVAEQSHHLWLPAEWAACPLLWPSFGGPGRCCKTSSRRRRRTMAETPGAVWRSVRYAACTGDDTSHASHPPTQPAEAATGDGQRPRPWEALSGPEPATVSRRHPSIPIRPRSQHGRDDGVPPTANYSSRRRRSAAGTPGAGRRSVARNAVCAGANRRRRAPPLDQNAAGTNSTAAPHLYRATVSCFCRRRPAAGTPGTGKRSVARNAASAGDDDDATRNQLAQGKGEQLPPPASDNVRTPGAGRRSVALNAACADEGRPSQHVAGQRRAPPPPAAGSGQTPGAGRRAVPRRHRRCVAAGAPGAEKCSVARNAACAGDEPPPPHGSGLRRTTARSRRRKRRTATGTPGAGRRTEARNAACAGAYSRRCAPPVPRCRQLPLPAMVSGRHPWRSGPGRCLCRRQLPPPHPSRYTQRTAAATGDGQRPQPLALGGAQWPGTLPVPATTAVAAPLPLHAADSCCHRRRAAAATPGAGRRSVARDAA
eukprot:gene1064-biopygen1696